MAKVTLFNGLTGLSCVVDAGGQGLRGKSWLDELSGFSHEAAEPTSLAGIGLGRLANFSAIIDGQKMGVKPLGESYSTPNYNGVDLFNVIAMSAVIGTGDSSETDFGGEALTEADPAHADYLNTTTDPKLAPAPAGAQSPAFLQTATEGSYSAVAGTMVFVVNGTSYSVATQASLTAELLAEDIRRAGVPVDVVRTPAANAATALRIFASGLGVTSTISVTTGTQADAAFPGTGVTSAVDTVYRGNGGPLGDTSQNGIGGSKVQKRILPGSVVVTATLATGAVTLTDDRAGVLSSLDGLQTGTIDYATGAIDVDFATAPTATPVNASWKTLVPVSLHSEVRLPEGSIGPVGGAPVVEMALILR